MSLTNIDDDKLRRIARLLIENREQSEEDTFWPFLSELNGKPADKKTANKFFFCCIIDYQMNANTIWERGKKFIEETLCDPENLWEVITSQSYDEWMSKFKVYRLHRFPKAYERLWRIGKHLVQHYDGDAKIIWNGQKPATVMDRLHEMNMGDQISNMCVGALIDTNQIIGVGDVKADINVRKVLGRIFQGEDFSIKDTIDITRKMHPENPWLLDRELYMIGKELCLKTLCYCDDCYLKSECEYTKGLIPIDDQNINNKNTVKDWNAEVIINNGHDMKIFIDDDKGYLKWINDNPDGYVVNCHRNPKPNYLVLHKATCPKINNQSKNGKTWTNRYIKLCSKSIVELNKWTKENVGGEVTFCPNCNP